MFSVSKSCALLCKEDSGLRPMFVGMLERRGINAMNERKHPEAGVFTGCILWPTDPVTRCSAAVVPALQHCSTAPSCCSKPCYDAAVHNASMERLA